ncbi:MAG: hypothetical protein WD078_08800 [Woeseia sp.]
MKREAEKAKAAAQGLLATWAETLSADERKAVDRAMDAGATIELSITFLSLRDPFVVTATFGGAHGGPHILFQLNEGDDK